MLQHPLLATFECIGDKCEDTCCKGWAMQVDPPTHEKYKTQAPELIPDVEYAEEADSWIMRKDTQTGYCVRFEDGLCGIHKKYGDSFLGDACHFYPRVTRSMGDITYMSATLSCPEVARQSLFADLPPALNKVETGRVPNTLKDYLPENMEAEQAMTIHRAFLEAACDTSLSAEENMMQIVKASQSLAMMPQKNWALMINFYLQDAKERMSTPMRDINNAFNLLHMLCGLVIASQKPPSDRLQKTISEMETSLAATLDWQNITIQTHEENSIAGLQKLLALWTSEGSALYGPVLRRWLNVQINMSLYPFAGFGATLEDRAMLMAMRMAIMKLALLSAHQVKGAALEQNEVVRVIQSLSRLLDHLADPSFSSQIAKDGGWAVEEKLHGLLLL